MQQDDFLDRKRKRVFSSNNLYQRLLGDRELVQMVLENFLKDVPPQVEMLAEALLTGELTEARRLTHKLKGASGNIGGDLFAAELLCIEEKLDAGVKIYPEERVAALRDTFNALTVAIQVELDQERS